MGVWLLYLRMLTAKKEKTFFSYSNRQERESKEFLDLEDKMGGEKEVKEATISSLQTMSRDGVILKHRDDSYSYFSLSEASDALEIHKRLNNKNKAAFEDDLEDSQDKVSMIHFFQEKAKKGSHMTNKTPGQIILDAVASGQYNAASEIMSAELFSNVNECMCQRKEKVASDFGQEISEGDSAYDTFFKKAMKKFGISSSVNSKAKKKRKSFSTILTRTSKPVMRN